MKFEILTRGCLGFGYILKEFNFIVALNKDILIYYF